MSGHVLVKVKCAECGKETLARRYLVQAGHTRFFCNLSCAGKYGCRASKNKRLSILKSSSFREDQSQRMKQYYLDHPEKITTLCGKNNPAYKHGEARDRQYTGFTETKKQQIRERDSHTCQLCGRVWSGDGARFHVHHIDYDKDNFDDANLVTLCRSCHGRTHYNRNYWKELFRKKARKN